MTLRYYSSVAQDTTLQAQVLTGATSMSVGATIGWPTSYPFTLALDYGTSAEELVDVTGVAGLVATISRGVDSTTAITHNAGATVRHVLIARDMREANAHVNASTAVHGITGLVVGNTDTQTLTNKTITGAGNNIIPWTNTAIAGNTTLVARNQYFLTTSSPWTLTLPATPAQGDEIRILDISGQAQTNNVTVNPNGLNFQGSVQNLILAYNYFSITLLYTGTTYGWKVA